MTHSGNGLGADLYDLDTVAKSELPTVSSVYGDAIGKCQAALQLIDGMPPEPPEFVGGQHGSVFEAYRDLHQALLGVLNETRTSLDETATALAQAAELYADTDRAAADEFHRRLHDRGEPKPW